MVDENLDDASIIMAVTEAMPEDSSFGDNLEDLTNSVLETEILMREPDSSIEEFVVRYSYIKDESKIGAKNLSKVWRIDHETSERTLGVPSKSCAIMHNSSLTRSYSSNDRILRGERIDRCF